MKIIQCPACSSEVSININYCKLMSCTYCHSTLFLDDNTIKHIGQRATLADYPSILKLGLTFNYKNEQLIPRGRIQFDYGQGLWEEWWVITPDQQGLWISIDEGDIAIEKEWDMNMKEKIALPNFQQLKIGENVVIRGSQYRVTEKNSATCVGSEGQLPKIIFSGDRFNYIDLTSSIGTSISAEYDEQKLLSLYEGLWIDPFELTAL
jgi:hypothetical protein